MLKKKESWISYVTSAPCEVSAFLHHADQVLLKQYTPGQSLVHVEEAQRHRTEAACHRLTAPVSLETIPEDSGESANDDWEVEASHSPSETGGNSEADPVPGAHPAASYDKRGHTDSTNGNSSDSLFAVETIGEEGGSKCVG
jgi:hypothetical protein